MSHRQWPSCHQLYFLKTFLHGFSFISFKSTDKTYFIKKCVKQIKFPRQVVRHTVHINIFVSFCSLGPLKKSLERAQKVIVPQKKNYVPQFLKRRYINSYNILTPYIIMQQISLMGNNWPTAVGWGLKHFLSLYRGRTYTIVTVQQYQDPPDCCTCVGIQANDDVRIELKLFITWTIPCERCG